MKRTFNKNSNSILNKKFLATSFIITGTIIGAGILGLPFVFSRSGYAIGFFWIIFLGLIMMYCFLAIGEVTLRTKGNHQLPGYAKKYLGKMGGRIMLLAVIFGCYTALLAYLIGEGESLSSIFTGTTNYSLYFALGFWFTMTLLLKEGLRGLRKVETWGVLGIILIILLIAALNFQHIDYNNLITNNITFSKFMLPLGIVLFALMGFSSIPESRINIKKNEKKFKKAIILGVSIPIILYIIFTLIAVGSLGDKIPEVATIGFGKIAILLGIFTMLTSYFVLSFSLKDVFKFDMNLSKRLIFILVSIIPILIYLVLFYLKRLDFISVLEIGGTIVGGVEITTVLFMNQISKKKGNRKPEYEIYNNWFITIILSLFFIAAIIYKIFL